MDDPKNKNTFPNDRDTVDSALQYSLGSNLKDKSKIFDDLPPKYCNGSNGNSYNDVEISKEKKTAWHSIYLSSAITFMSAVQFSLYFTSLWPFMKVVSPLDTLEIQR
ncbi:hypothetical protein Ddc_12858 [Ditylenchus destructor]|nr:hypothetical protein Ddc_12858 [Ditylenchus destructor]